ncbi:MAG: ATP synthase F1 subunit gamma [Prolixibacteraceae bacterium]|jgi:F-type H+-transporting ATPase subunit gamma|nr:ATP synthase F1 subunit gamma [Prolixibacteraceae bacterium]
MAKLKEIRSRISSVKNTRQVTSAMKLVSAAKLKRAQDNLMHIAPYERKLDEILHQLTIGDINIRSVFFKTKEPDKILIVVIGSNRGLCGAFNSNVAKMAIQHAQKNYRTHFQMNNIHFLPIGQQMVKEFKKFSNTVASDADKLIDSADYDSSTEFVQQLMKWFIGEKYQKIDILYNKFKNAAVHEPTVEQFLPIEEPDIKDPSEMLTEYIFEPGKSEVYNELIPLALKMHFYSLLLESVTAEHGARMTSMHQATDNATNLLSDLRKTYNNLRQSAITNEIIEITGGAEALNH